MSTGGARVVARAPLGRRLALHGPAGEEPPRYGRLPQPHLGGGSRTGDKPPRYGRRRVLGLGAGLLLAACSGPAEDALPPPPADAGSLRVVMGLAESEWRVVREVVLAPFEQETGVRVVPVQMEAADLVRQLDAQVQAGAVSIDLFTQDNNQLAPLVARGLLEDLTPYADLIPAETPQALRPVLEFDGRLYFLPYRPNVQITYYLESHFAQYGLAPPRTWAELLAVGREFETREKFGRVVIQGVPGGPVGVVVTEFLWQGGGNPLDLTAPGSAQAFEFLQQLEPYLAPVYQTAKFDTINTYLASETAYLGQNWPFGADVIVKQYRKQGVGAYSGWAGPSGEFHVLGGEVIGIPKGTPRREMALQFARFLMSRPVQEALVQRLAWPPMRDDAFGAVAEWQQPYFAAVQAALAQTRARPNVVYWGEVERILSDAFRDVVTNRQPVQPTLARYQAQIEQARAAAR
jgi:trehalose transport system substrate-binding protein